MNHLTLLALLCLASSCHRWQIQPAMPMPTDIDQQPATVRITRNDASRVVLHDATFLNDSVHGRKSVGYYGSADHAEALINVRTVEVREVDANKTAALVTVLVVFATATAVFLHALSTAFN